MTPIHKKSKSFTTEPSFSTTRLPPYPQKIAIIHNPSPAHTSRHTPALLLSINPPKKALWKNRQLVSFPQCFFVFVIPSVSSKKRIGNSKTEANYFPWSYRYAANPSPRVHSFPCKLHPHGPWWQRLNDRDIFLL